MSTTAASDFVAAMDEATSDAADEFAPVLAKIPQYPVEALPAPAQALVKDAAAAGLPAALVAGAALAALAAAIGSAAEFDVLSGERAVLWVPLIAPAGAGKSPAQTLAFTALRQRDADGEDDEPRVLLGDSTLEALARELHAAGGAACLDLDELSLLLRGIGEYKRGSGDRGRLLALWTGAPWSVSRVAGGGAKNAVKLRIKRPTLSICGGLQPHLHELLGPDEDGSRVRWLPHVAAMPGPPACPETVPTSTVPAAWDELLRDLVGRRSLERRWTLSRAAVGAFAAHRAIWKANAQGVETQTVSGALAKADVHLARVALVLADSERHGASAGAVSIEQVERAALLVNYALACWRALPAAGGLALSRRDELLDTAVERLRGWLEQRPAHWAWKRDIQRAHVAGVRTPADLDALLGRYEATYPGSVGTEAASSGGLPRVRVRAPARSGVAIGDTGTRRDENPRQRWGSATVATGDSECGDTAPGGPDARKGRTPESEHRSLADVSGAEGLAAFTGSVFLDADEPPLRPPHDPLCAYPRQHAGRSWRSHTGRLVCGVCHPPSHPSLIADAAADE